MKRLASAIGILALAAPLAFAQTSTWVPDKAHSGVDFSILHMGLAKVRGHFGNIGGKIVWNDADITKSSVDVTIDVSTVDTGTSGRDADLKSDHIFDAKAQFPTATFTSTSVAKNGSSKLTVAGNLTLHGVTKPVTLEVDAAPQAPFRAWTTSRIRDFQPQRPSAARRSGSGRRCLRRSSGTTFRSPSIWMSPSSKCPPGNTVASGLHSRAKSSEWGWWIRWRV